MDTGIRSRWPALVGLALLATALSCRDVPEAPPETPPAAAVSATFTLDTICPRCGVVDVLNLWMGVTLLQAPDQSVHIIGLDPWAERLRYHGCANVCADPTHWFGGTADTARSPYQWFDTWSTAVLTPAGIQVVYSNCGPGAGCDGVRYATCPGACNFADHWSDTTLFAGRGDVGAGEYGGQSTSLAADPTGGLHLLLEGPTGSLSYEYCAGLCTDSASWHGVQIDSETARRPLPSYVRFIAVDPPGGVHVLYTTRAGLMHASCAGVCTSAASWRSGLAFPGLFAGGLSLAFGPDGRLQLAYVDGVGTVTYATCGSPCDAPGTWSEVRLPLRTTDVSIATDTAGAVFLASTFGNVVLSRCDSGCLDLTAWHHTVVDSSQGGGHVSLAVDASGHARLASTSLWNTLQYTQMLP